MLLSSRVHCDASSYARARARARLRKTPKTSFRPKWRYIIIIVAIRIAEKMNNEWRLWCDEKTAFRLRKTRARGDNRAATQSRVQCHNVIVVILYSSQTHTTTRRNNRLEKKNSTYITYGTIETPRCYKH